jgi:DNA-directed RNA polymerase delta subunit
MKTTKDITANISAHKLDVNAEVDFIFGAPKLKKDRDRSVLSDRFGLTGSKPKTLEEIGKSLGITRERVRQIEKNTLKKLSDFVSADLRGQEITSVITAVIESNGGIIRTVDFDKAILGDESSAKAKHQLAFIVACSVGVGTYQESNTVYKSNYIAPVTSQITDKIIKEAISILKAEAAPIEEKVLVESVRKGMSDITASAIVAAVSVCKGILKTDTGHLGLSHWRDINPRSIKDKTYYILKKHKKPLHYTEISDHIQNFAGKEKHVTRQAVHNELIRDERFVLIGRGIYALSEWGYASGVVEEVIEAVLIETGRPMHKDDIIAEVLKRRMVKETTILLNLQKKRFKRVARATYTISNGRE